MGNLAHGVFILQCDINVGWAFVVCEISANISLTFAFTGVHFRGEFYYMGHVC